MPDLRKRKSLVNMLRDRKGGVLLVGAITLPVVIGAAALATEFGFALASRVENQRVADLASYAGAVAYSKNKSETEMRAAAERMAQLNGLAPGNVSASLVASPRTAGASAVSVTVTTQKSLVLAPVLGFDTGMDIAALAMAEVAAAAAAPSGGCILALKEGGTGLVLEGGTQVTANNCEVSSNAVVTVPCGTKIVTPKLNYNSSSAPRPCNNNIVTSTGGAAPLNKTLTPDPIAAHAGVQSLVSRLATAAGLAAPVAPAAPSVPKGTDLNFQGGWSSSTANAVKSAAGKFGCNADWAGSKWTFTCPSSVKKLDIGSFSLAGGVQVDFALTSAHDVIFNFSGNIDTASTVNFGPGIYNVAGYISTKGTTSFKANSLSVGGRVTTTETTTFAAGSYRLSQGLNVSGTTTFGAGTFDIGPLSSGCDRVSICTNGGATLTFGGPSTFNLTAGLSNAGGARITMGSGSSNSYRFGPSTAGHAFTLGGQSTTILEDATAPGSKFEIVGNINAGGGGSCLALPAAANHDIKGNLNGAGALILGNGIWTLDGYMHLGASSGGAANCKGQSVSVRGESVSIIVSGKNVPNSGTCANRAFCVAAGYSGIVLKAPTSGEYRDLAFIGPQTSSVTAGALFAGGASGSQISGAFYFPHGPIMMDGGASATAVDSGCLTLIGTAITLKGGTSALSQCAGLTVAAPAGSGRVSLVR